jgi:hypothetical protein
MATAKDAVNAQAQVQSWPPGLLTDPSASPDWLVAHVKPKQEKLLAGELRQRALPGALFLKVHVRRYPGKGPQTSLVPILPGYLFAVDAPGAKEALYASGRVVRLLPVTRPDELRQDIHDLARLLTANPGPVLVRPELQPGSRVVLGCGTLAGCAGVVLRRQGLCEIVVNVRMLGTSVAVQCSASDVEPEPTS